MPKGDYETVPRQTLLRFRQKFWTQNFVVSEKFLGCSFKPKEGVLRKFQGCVKEVSGKFQESFRDVSSKCQGCFNGISWVFQITFKVVSRK